MKARQIFDLSGRVAIITGGSVGLGRQMAEGLAEMGVNLVLCARKYERCLQTAEELQKLGVQVLALSCDVKDPVSIGKVVDATVSKFGRIDILINNAGTAWGALVEDMTLAQWNKVVETNLTGTFLFAQAAGKVMIAQQRGKIINIASIAGMRGHSAELPAIGYSSSKGGVIAFTRDLAWKWGMHGIRVNAIAPGWFPSDMSQKMIELHQDKLLASIPLGRFGASEDLKGAAIFLASDASDFVTGHILVVDGGQSA
jgi:NAD(P)-dependent dehydrogenase (short-subunit alcohol dehydrogenase family)